MKYIRYTIKISFVGLFVIGLAQLLTAQQARVSPPKELTSKLGELSVVVKYSAPSVKERTIWGGLVPYEKVWRTGANEATTIEVNQNVLIEGEALNAGRYSLFTIPSADNWIFIFNSVPDQWGHFSYDSGKDVLRVQVEPEKTDKFQEMLSFDMQSKSGSDKVVLHWENLAVGFKIEPATEK